jgi:TonB family protein
MPARTKETMHYFPGIPVHGLFNLLIIFALSCASSAFCQSDLREVGQKDAFAEPLFIVSPVFPADVSTDLLPVEIRVTGTVTTEGRFKAPVFIPAEGKEPFLRTILEVLPGWRFRPATTPDTCKPRDSDAVVIVYFELKDGKPVISISSPVHFKEPPTDPASTVTGKTFVRQPRAEYPEPMARRGIEGAVEVMVLVDEEGEIVSKNILYSIPSTQFGEAVLTALRRASFVKLNPARRICYVFGTRFCMGQQQTTFPEPRCHRK